MNILIFGPNGSGKGTQGSVVQKKYGIPLIETGAIFRDNIKKGTELGNQAKAFIDRGDLVPDDVTIPMILSRLQEADCKNGIGEGGNEAGLYHRDQTRPGNRQKKDHGPSALRRG
jgi:adenylate kinase